MVFELISWIYISLVCLLWGNQVLKLFFGIAEVTMVGFPIVCFLGMSVIGIGSFYLSLAIPLYIVIKLAWQVVAFLFLLNKKNRTNVYAQIKRPFNHFSVSDTIFLSAIGLMLLFVSTSVIIHPDTLSYHAFLTDIFNTHGSLRGIANLEPKYGLQSTWFAELAFFDFSLFHSVGSFPLNGCVMLWFALFLISRCSVTRDIYSQPQQFLSGIWYLFLILFCLLSWTQIRLTASSMSPDFIAVISILLAFYFFTGKQDRDLRNVTDLLAVFFSAMAVTVKFSAIPVLGIPFLIISNRMRKSDFLAVFKMCLCIGLLLLPVVVRNFISTGYPFFPSSLGAFFPADWKLDTFRVQNLQHYITVYARYPVLMVNTAHEYSLSFRVWFPLWWKHIYVIDKAVMLLIGFGILLNLFFIRNRTRPYSRREIWAFFISFAGFLFWFIEAPDPRFGTGFLLPLLYFLYHSFVQGIFLKNYEYAVVLINWLKKISIVFICLYIGYRAIYFFHPGQLLFPDGTKNESLLPPDCEERYKKMILVDRTIPPKMPDSCRIFQFRGTTIEEGFKPYR
jgi:hypothetical protein